MKYTIATAFTTLLTLTSAAPTPLSPPLSSTTLLPVATSQYNVRTGAVTYATPEGLLLKNPWADTTALTTFTFPASSAGKRCTLEFYLDPTARVLDDNQQAQVFTSQKPATQTTTTWPSGNLRDQHVADIKFNVGRNADVTATYGRGVVFDCPAGQTLGYEFVPRGERAEVYWNVATAGPRVTYY